VRPGVPRRSLDGDDAVNTFVLMNETTTLLDPPPIVTPGVESGCAVRVRNDSTVVEHFELELLGDCGTWASLEPSSLTIFPGEQASAMLTFRAPKSSAVLAGVHTYGVRVVASEQRSSEVVEGEVTVAAFVATNAELTPLTSRARGRARHRITVDNFGNVATTVALSAEDPDQLLSMRLRPSMLTVPPGAALVARVGVRARRKLWRGPVASRPFHVGVEDGESPQQLLQGRLDQVAVIPPGLPRALGRVGAVALALVAAWFLVLRPTVKSAADDAAVKRVAKSTTAVQKSAAQAETAAKNAKKSEENTLAGTSGTSRTVAVPSPFTHRLPVTAKAGQTSSATFTVPKGKTVTVTDTLFENDGADQSTGFLTLELEKAPLIRVPLTYIGLPFNPGLKPGLVVGAGQQLRLSLSCVAPAKPATAVANTDAAAAATAAAASNNDLCRAAVLVAGTQVKKSPVKQTKSTSP
jgi:hypothetical protein